MPAPARPAIALFTALVAAILGSAAIPLAAANAAGGESGHQAAPGKSQGSNQSSPKANKDKPESPGNNGTVKLAGFVLGNGPGHSGGSGSTPEHPSNDPHLPCEFSIEWFGFDAATPNGDPVVSTVTFAQHSPTPGTVTPGTDSVILDGDSAAGGGSTAGFDGVETYRLSFTGEPHPKHGYHVKITVETPYSQGSDRKHKVYWVEPCETAVAQTSGTSGTHTPGTPGTETEGEETETGGKDDIEVEGEEAAADNDSADSSSFVEANNIEVAGVQAQARTARGTVQLASVPTAVAAGLGNEAAGLTRSPLSLALVLLGLGMVGTALYRRVRA